MWGVFLLGMAVPVVVSVVAAGGVMHRAFRQSRESNIWSEVCARLQPEDPMAVWLWPLAGSSFLAEHDDVIAVRVADLAAVKEYAETHAGDVRAALAALGRPDASLLFLTADDFWLLPPDAPLNTAPADTDDNRPPFE